MTMSNQDELFEALKTAKQEQIAATGEVGRLEVELAKAVDRQYECGRAVGRALDAIVKAAVENCPA